MRILTAPACVFLWTTTREWRRANTLALSWRSALTHVVSLEFPFGLHFVPVPVPARYFPTSFPLTFTPASQNIFIQTITNSEDPYFEYVVHSDCILSSIHELDTITFIFTLDASSSINDTQIR
ncbi:hypothetical protein CYLTODRAFT_427264 [Cylindrobasidium torrendii FP15055 ss-10]|uniref:Uncharacterized protein n=1 Tax=Cylindrobasidium torrendii FP15055 ss-10 TaxID=1314674 RepID=A0A0D7AXC2_9AGAR|nr:hypothetical protein CYLTODRAFT_427264 [Cylindrobasidium torrendii FP15055 ss-10]